jgi:hypothetical protein
MAATLGALGQDYNAAHQWQHQHSGPSPSPSSSKPMHGKKRPAEDRLETEQRLSKRLDLLNLGMCTLCAWENTLPFTLNAPNTILTASLQIMDHVSTSPSPAI